MDKQEPKQLSWWWRFVPWPWGEPTTPLQWFAGRAAIFMLIVWLLILVGVIIEALN